MWNVTSGPFSKNHLMIHIWYLLATILLLCELGTILMLFDFVFCACGGAYRERVCAKPI